MQGRAGHAGTTPMDYRSDALVAAAKILATFPQIAKETGNGTVITTGRLQVFPNGANVIPDKVVFTVDIRSGKEEQISEARKQVDALLSAHNGVDGITISAEEQLFIEPKELDSELRGLLKEMSDELSIPYCSMSSGAGHDAMVLSDFTACGMLFIPSKDGLSHCPEEWSDAGDLADGTDVLFETIKRLVM